MRFLIYVLTIVLSISFFSCKIQNTNSVTIKFWAMGSEAEKIAGFIQDFESKHPGIKVKLQQVPWTAAQEKLITAFASDNTPDLCQLGNTWIPQFVSLNAIMDLSDLIKKSNRINKNKFFKGVWETNINNNRVFGIPWYVDTRIMFYRKDIFESAGFKEPPKNWDELYTLCRNIKKIYGQSDKYPIFIPTNEWSNFVIFGLQAGADLLKDNCTRGNFDSPEFKKAFDFLIRFHRENLTPLGMMQVNNIYQAMADGVISIYISGPWNLPSFKEWMKNELADKWSTAPLPGINERYPGISLAGGSSLVIFKNSKYKNEAWKLIEYLSDHEIQTKIYSVTNNLPANIESWKDPILSNDKYMRAFYEQLQNVKSTPKVPEWEQIVFSKLQQYVEYAARRVMTVDEALTKLDIDTDKILEKRRWINQQKDKR